MLLTMSAWAGTIAARVNIATFQVAAVGARSTVFQRMLGMSCAKCLPVGRHGSEEACA